MLPIPGKVGVHLPHLKNNQNLAICAFVADVAAKCLMVE